MSEKGWILDIIEWCNVNNSFLTGVLAVLTLIVSMIAIGFYIQTSRLPYKKKLLLSSDILFVIGNNIFTGINFSQLNSLTVNAVNVGNRKINMIYLGFVVKEMK